jgi:hypothetical protein
MDAIRLEGHRVLKRPRASARPDLADALGVYELAWLWRSA